MKKSKFLLVLFFSLFFAPAFSQESSIDDLRKEIQLLNESMKAMQKDMQEIKSMLQSRMPAVPPANVLIDTGKNAFRGERTAKLTLVEFSDYQ
jgi:hypothetical protein